MAKKSNNRKRIEKEEQLPLEDQETSAPQQRKEKRANDLDGASWTKNSISVWSDVRKSQEESQLGHPAIFPGQLVRRLIESFTRKEDRYVLDPFCGSGSTVVTASRMGRVGIGFEINPDYVEVTKRRLNTRELWNPQLDTESIVYQEDSRKLSNFISEGSIDLVVTSPPYWDILSQKRTADGKEIRDYGETSGDLGKISDYRKFIEELSVSFQQIYKALKGGKYCIVVVMDIRKQNRFFPLHSDIADMMQRIGFVFDDIIIWDRRHEYNNLRPLGYPAVFRINKVHEYILVFQKI